MGNKDSTQQLKTMDLNRTPLGSYFPTTVQPTGSSAV